MTASTERRIAALRDRAVHPATPPAEAAVCREKLVQLATEPVWVEVMPGVSIDLAGITIAVEGVAR